MRRLVYLCCAMLVAALLVTVLTDSQAAIKVKTIGRSLNSMTAPVRGASAPPWNISSGVRAIGIQSRVYFEIDTLGSGAVGSPSWTLVSKPSGSTATLDSANGKFINSFKADMGGQYVVSGTVGTQSASDTVFASTYVGVASDAQAGCVCHSLTPGFSDLVARWRGSAHSTIFKRGITGYLEVERGKGAYATACIKCHTTGWDNTANNNNFGFQVKQTGWDTTWYQGLEFYNGDYWITTGDTSRWAMLNANQKMQANIGCEQCHGPAGDHRLTADKTKIGKTIDGGVCNQCHDGSRRHSLGTYYNLSLHKQLPTGGAAEGGRSSCQPCHTGKGFLYYLDHNKDTTGLAASWNVNTDAGTSISCQVCHDPHGSSNPAQLRTVTIKGDTLRNGYRLPANLRSSTGLLCVNCHAARYRTQDRVKPNSPPYYGFTNRFGPHENPQGDMFFGTSGYQYGDESFTGLMTHAGVEGACVGCHMQGRMNRLDGSGNVLPNHSFSMTDTTYATGVWKPTQVCVGCHGEIEDFNDIRAFYDYDRNGVIEGVETEIQGLLNILKSRLPIDTTTGEPVTMLKDSLKVKNRFDYVSGIWNYYMVKNDGSMGMHNTKYAVRLLYKSLGWTPLFVKSLPGTPTEFALEQNYPNPFNPTTTIRFSLPKEEHVRLQVFDITGALVKTIVDEALRSSNVEVTWDGTNTNGAKVASGMYLYRLQAGNFVATKKMILMK